MKGFDNFRWRLTVLLVGGLVCAGMMLDSPVSVMAAADTGDEALQLAMHHGRPHGGRHERHQLHHGMGRGGAGICPQTRATGQAPDAIRNQANPMEASPENLNRGESLYQRTAEPTACKICHGPTGNGLGMMAQGLSPMPRNFTCKETMREISDGQMFWIIKNGSPGTGMPPYGRFLADDDIWRLVLYLRSLSKP